MMSDRSQTLLHMLPLDLRSVFSSEPACSLVFVKLIVKMFRMFQVVHFSLIWLI